MNLGELLNTVDTPQYPCPGCERREALAVYERAAVWQCGYTRWLPRLSWRRR